MVICSVDFPIKADALPASTGSAPVPLPTWRKARPKPTGTAWTFQRPAATTGFWFHGALRWGLKDGMMKNCGIVQKGSTRQVLTGLLIVCLFVTTSRWHVKFGINTMVLLVWSEKWSPKSSSTPTSPTNGVQFQLLFPIQFASNPRASARSTCQPVRRSSPGYGTSWAKSWRVVCNVKRRRLFTFSRVFLKNPTIAVFILWFWQFGCFLRTLLVFPKFMLLFKLFFIQLHMLAGFHPSQCYWTISPLGP